MSDERNKRNEVFNQGTKPSDVDSEIKSISQYDAARQDFNLDIPVELVPVPSNGKVYPKSSSLYNRDSIEIRSMTTREEDILTSKALLKKGTVITELIRSCLVDKTVDPVSMLVGDRNALMVAIRITGYGHEYDAEVTCGNDECAQNLKRTFNLAELPIQRLEIEPIVEGENLFEFMLPHTKKLVKFRFLTGLDEEDINVTLEKQKKLNLQSSSTVTTNLLHTLVSVDGIDNRAKVAQFVRMMPARDSLMLRNYIRDNEPGIRMKQETTCPACGHEEVVSIPLGVTFLWPNAAG
jgi:hypothetical protein